jgi:ribosomal protein L11 methylase PrmA
MKTVDTSTMKGFENKFLELTHYKYDKFRVFDDFLTMSVCAFHPVNIQSLGQEKDADNEKLYMDTIARYDKEFVREMAAMLPLYMIFVHQNPFVDGLGDVYMEYLSNKYKGQFFTPTDICRMMAVTTIVTGDKHKRVLDPAVGSGRMILAAAEIAPQNLFFGNDIDLTCVKMCLLNCYLNGLSAEICWGDSIAMDYWKVWRVNWQTEGILPIDPETSYAFRKPEIVAKVPQPKPPKNGQLKLF